jgi:hypothetical protein
VIDMEGKQQQEDCNVNPQHDNDETDPLTTSNKKQSSKENNKEQLESTTYHQDQHQHTCAADTEGQMMKLIVRSP